MPDWPPKLGSAALGLLADAASFLVSAACLLRLRLPQPTLPRAARPAAAPLRTRVREGIDYVRRDRILRFFTLLGGVSNFGLTGSSTLLVLFLVRDLRLSPAVVGVVMAAGSVGGLIGATVATRVSRRLGSARALLGLQVLAGPSALLVPLGAPGGRVALVVAGLVLVGVGVVAGNVIRGAWRNRYVPEEMLARQVTTAQVVNLGTMPVAALAAGWLGAHAGLRPTMALMALIHAVACLAMFASPIRGLREMPEAQPAREEYAVGVSGR